MRKLSLYLTSLFLLLVLASRAQEAKVATLDPPSFNESEIKLSELVDDISWVQFETPTPLVIKEHYMDNNCIILKTSEGIKRFNKEGKLLNNIADSNKYYEKMAINEVGRKVYLLAENGEKLFTYSFNGILLNTVELPKHKIAFPESFLYENEKLYFMFSITVSDLPTPQNEWATLDINSFNPIFKKAVTKVWGQKQRGPLYITRHNNQLLYWNIFNDAIYRLKGDTHPIAYQWTKGDYRFNLQDGMKFTEPMRKECLRLFSLCETQKYLWLELKTTDGGYPNTYIYNRQTGEGRKTTKIIDDIWGTNLKIFPHNYYKLNGREYITMVIRSEKLKGELVNAKNEIGKKQAQKMNAQGGTLLLLRLKK